MHFACFFCFFHLFFIFIKKKKNEIERERKEKCNYVYINIFSCSIRLEIPSFYEHALSYFFLFFLACFFYVCVYSKIRSDLI